MAFENFVPTVESKLLMEERDKVLVLGKNCRSKYNGDLKKIGDEVIIKGINSPTIYTLNKDGTYSANEIAAGNIAGTGKKIVQNGIPDVEELDGYDFKIKIQQVALWNYGLGDLDDALTDTEFMGKLRKKQAIKVATKQDSYIASVISNFAEATFTGASDYSRANNVYYINEGINGTTNNGNVSTDTAETINPADLIEEMQLLLKERNYGNTELFLECSERFFLKVTRVLRGLNVNAGSVGKKFSNYQNITFFPNNSMTINGQDFVFLRTADSVAFVDKVAKMEAYRPEKGFMDAVKGFNLYDAAITDPKGLVIAKVAY